MNKLYKLKLKEYFGISVFSNPLYPYKGFMIYEDEIIMILDLNHMMYNNLDGYHCGIKAFNVTQNRVFYTDQISLSEFVEIWK